jgi:hypothetical protein
VPTPMTLVAALWIAKRRLRFTSSGWSRMPAFGLAVPSAV